MAMEEPGGFTPLSASAQHGSDAWQDNEMIEAYPSISMIHPILIMCHRHHLN
jgi:hypothetical protein